MFSGIIFRRHAANIKRPASNNVVSFTLAKRRQNLAGNTSLEYDEGNGGFVQGAGGYQ